jgi:hypothetical protein
VGRLFQRITILERWGRSITAAIFILVGIYYILRYALLLF